MHLPLVFMDGPWRMTMGLRALERGDWLWRDRHFVDETDERQRLVAARRDEVVAMLPGMAEACVELLRAVRDDLARHHVVTEADHAEDDPLARLATLAQEDFCLLQKGENGDYVLRAGLLCFPLHWRLREKLGLPMRAIHGPVPGFADKLGGSADRFMAALTADRPVWRANWTLTEKPDLFQPGRRQPVPDLDDGNAGDRLWLRVERQTLRRLPRSGAVVFGIRTLVRPLGEIGQEPGVAVAMAARIREMAPEMARYKGIPPLRAPLLAWLERQAELAAPAPAAELATAGG